MNVSHQKVTVIGTARSGQAAVALLQKTGAAVQLSEQKTWPQLDPSVQEWLASAQIRFETGGHTEEFIKQSDMLVISPGVRPDAPCVRWAKDAGIAVVSEIELAWRSCPCPVIAVTGSNGKTTVSTLTAQVLRAGGYRVGLCGNIGYPFSACLLAEDPLDYIVLEVSSFQLEAIDRFRPHVAVFLNFSQNHLDRHKDLQEYFQAKCRIFANQGQDDYALINAADPVVDRLRTMIKAQEVLFNTSEQRATWSTDNPNFLAAAEAGRLCGVSAEAAGEVFRAFPGVEHRLEKVRVWQGVEYINDSKSTTTEAGRWALERMACPVIMICGGRDKNLDFLPLRPLVRNKVKTLVVFGEARDKIAAAFQNAVPTHHAEDLAAAVRLAQQSSESGDAILFSPMCASFDMFTNYEERGRAFKALVQDLSE